VIERGGRKLRVYERRYASKIRRSRCARKTG
jgi:hypothetical protein